MRIGIISDTHNCVDRTRTAVEVLSSQGVEVLVHCGDLAVPEIVAECAVLPFYFVFGNHDADSVPALRAAAEEHGATCLGWAGEFKAAEKRIGVCHGHLSFDLRPLLDSEPEYLLTGHFHEKRDWREGRTRRINPGALYRTGEYSVALLDTESDDVQFISVCESTT